MKQFVLPCLALAAILIVAEAHFNFDRPPGPARQGFSCLMANSTLTFTSTRENVTCKCQPEHKRHDKRVFIRFPTTPNLKWNCTIIQPSNNTSPSTTSTTTTTTLSPLTTRLSTSTNTGTGITPNKNSTTP